MRLYAPPHLSNVWVDRLRECVESRHLTTGPVVEELRKDLARRFQYSEDEIVLGNSATNVFRALCMVLSSRGVSGVRWDEPTFPVMKQEGTKVLGPDLGEWGRPAGLRVHTEIGGVDPRLEPSEDAVFNLLDACHSWAPRFRFDGSLVSFYPTKLAGGAEGGALFLRDRELAALVQQVVCCGFAPGSQRGVAAGEGRDFSGAVRGIKANMTDVQACFGLGALEHLGANARAIAMTWYGLRGRFEAAGMGHRVRMRTERPYLFQVWSGSVSGAREAYARRGVPTGWNFPPAPWVTLPCHGELTRCDLDTIVNASKEVL